jgi:hypothetical protein
LLYLFSSSGTPPAPLRAGQMSPVSAQHGKSSRTRTSRGPSLVTIFLYLFVLKGSFMNPVAHQVDASLPGRNKLRDG